MPTNRTPLRRRRRGLSHAQSMLLLFGGGDARWEGAFDDEAEARDAWQRHRDRLMAGCSGRRPAGWWLFESPIAWPGYDRERSALYDAELLEDGERAELLAFWRVQFERAQDARFFHALNPDHYLHGPAARRAHYRATDIPLSLLREWKAARRRSAHTISQLAAATP